jgi:hypothetical protein
MCRKLIYLISFSLTIAFANCVAQGELTASLEVGDTSPRINLTDEGTADWVYWLQDSLDPINSKAGADDIGELVAIGNLDIQRTEWKTYWDVEYSDGTDPVSGTADDVGHRFRISSSPTVDEGYDLVVAAGVLPRVLKLYIHNRECPSIIRATLGDESLDTTFPDPMASQDYLYTLEFSHPTADELHVTYFCPAGAPTYYSIRLGAVTLSGELVRQLVKAYSPSPANGQADVPRDVVLGWKPGEYAPAINGHKVYLSENFNDVNDGIGGVAQDANSYAPPQRLDFDKTYYWRVDEVNGPPDYTVYQGDVWQFTTEPVGYPIENIIATASSVQQVDRGPENTVNGSGLDESGLLHDKVADDNMWLSSATGVQPTWIEYEFVGTTHEFARAPGAAGYAHNTTIDLSGVAAKYVRLTANSNWGGMLNQYGLSEVRFFYIPVLAREPNPDSGATDVPLGTIDEPIDVTLSWRAGREAVTHDVYFGADEQAVADGTVGVTTVTELRYGPLSLDLGKTYYWRIDEVNEAKPPTTWQGDLWDFTTQEYFIVDDFESYNDLDPTDPNSNRIFNTWIDGYKQPTNGSIVGYAEAPFCEQNIVHSDKQSMPLFYDNSGTANYSEATLTLGSRRDWTTKGVKALSLWFRGNPAAFVEEPAGTYTINADGADIWNQADEFRYVWKQLSGDGEIVAQVLSVENTHEWAKAGVMIRDTLDAGSPNVFAAITGGGGDGATFQWRTAPGGSSSSARTLVGISPPASIKLVRQGSLFTGYVFLDGQWQQEGRLVSVTMTDPVYIGLAVTSYAAGVTCKAEFSDIQTIGAVSGQFTEQAIGVDMPSNDPESMYVAVANSGGTPAVVRHGDPTATQAVDWTEWSILLTEFSNQGVVLTNVDSISIGFGDKANQQPGGSGNPSLLKAGS